MTKYFILGILVLACACIIVPMLLMNFGVLTPPARRRDEPASPPEPEDTEPAG